ncbi:MAG: SDR family oxidoreductase [Saprospiraceae bacterium]|jgi:3-oxoacyl-[acyl-carrier protein] reductase|uniref:SDR family oxidoreductase n=1 Tax=Candidatus Brachybacter algidus TaxID=2982024 RepID=UPI001B462BEF|nr:SDR family oxidoreductase [Candidatus Brachybacter algidus]MBP7306456.1 SDR family oxidoreductase [Saprospiraceae bacterium]MBK6373685.1 SDR family oxidoreductase [Candidatus Brachybacter algidus]MBK6450854.1 SDR family oxidoreductase [Candidatus Brachybacter algidus]MBK7604962.1 SDR family oxidoreductase [Candidatus Brachybacter algidus]MBK8354999.1 SDR family oxidoreductase [Candidatus Brachybacter algidus]
MNISLKNKYALVCGGSKGIGLASAIELSKLGCNVTLLARNPDSLGEAIKQLDKSQGQIHRFISVDQSNPTEVSKRLSTIGQGFHILVLNSGGPKGGRMIDASLEDLQIGFDSLLLSNQVIVKHSFEYMKKADFGRIINIISIGLKEPIVGLGVSNTIRGAVGNWSKSLAYELGPHGITVNNILPGYTMTDRLSKLMDSRAQDRNMDVDALIETYVEQIPAKRLATPDEIGNVVAFIATPAAGYINGINLPVDGGYLKSL